MPRFLHGASITLDEIRNTPEGQGRPIIKFVKALRAARKGNEKNFDFLFPRLHQDPANVLPTSPQTTKQLVNLGLAMNDDQDDAAGNSDIPAAYTYFGQFVDHDITLETFTPLPTLLDPNMQPLPLDVTRNSIENMRTATLDLDSVYGSPDQPTLRDARNAAKLQVGTVAPLNNPAVPFGRPAGKDDHNDLPRQARSTDVQTDRAALIGDPRNDENTIVAQLHVAFLRAHNAIVDQGHSFEDAQRLLRQHYQYIVLHDFLPRIADPAIVQDVRDNGNNVYRPLPNRFFLPLEYAVAAYRFGHSMVRGVYDFNVNFNPHGRPAVPATLGLLFTFSALSGQLGFPSDPNNSPHESGSDTLPENWIIEWERFVDGSARTNHARRINTQLVEPLQRLTDELGQPVGGTDATGKSRLDANLAVRNLLRGYLLRMPTGQAVVRALERPRRGNPRGRDFPVLTPQQIEAGAANGDQVTALRNGGFLDRTPLWYYVLAEAQVLGNGQHLGPVGSTIVAEVLVGLARRSRDSILDQRGWTPSLPSATPGTFTLPDLLRVAGVLGSQERAVGAGR